MVRWIRGQEVGLESLLVERRTHVRVAHQQDSTATSDHCLSGRRGSGFIWQRSLPMAYGMAPLPARLVWRNRR